MWLYWLFHSPSAMWPSSCFNSLSFISLLCHPFPLLHYQNTNLSVSFLVLLPVTLFPPLMPRPTQGQRASSWFRGLYFYSIITWAAVFLSLVASIMILMVHNTKGTKQGNIKHAPKTRPITLLSMTNVAYMVFFTLELLVLLTTNLTNLGSIWANVTPDQLVGAGYKVWLCRGPNNGSLITFSTWGKPFKVQSKWQEFKCVESRDASHVQASAVCRLVSFQSKESRAVDLLQWG
jgi:protein-S-isoprenylcysteine O-methyltransferase Ste14